jgi:hypothetical protein
MNNAGTTNADDDALPKYPGKTVCYTSVLSISGE